LYEYLLKEEEWLFMVILKDYNSTKTLKVNLKMTVKQGLI